ncbi:MAG: reverse transcriptase family protein [Pseudobutyrivibrio sp.]|nr:reverse transcriptase family protein [Pseudobutyrivibrio sp.]
MKNWNIKNIEEFIEQLEVTKNGLITSVKDDNKKKYYGDSIVIPKKNGERIIYSVNKNNSLYKIQKKLKEKYLDNIYLPDTVYGFVKKRSFFDYLAEHACNYGEYYLSIDISNFFDSIKEEHINDAFNNIFLQSDVKEEIIDYLKKILLYEGRLPQGSPCSPVVSNIIMRRLDIRIERYCTKVNVKYTRYADDMMFSSVDKYIHTDRFYHGIEGILKSEGFNLNYKKKRLSKDYIALNGMVLSGGISLSRKRLKKIGAVLFTLERNKYNKKIKIKTWLDEINGALKDIGYEHNFSSKEALIYFLAGYRSFVIQVLKSSPNNDGNKKLKNIITRIEKQIDILV